MTRYLVTLRIEALVSVDTGGEAAAAAAAQSHVANDWLLQFRDGVRKDAGYFSVKGLSGEVLSTRIWTPNGRITQAPECRDEVF